MGRRQRSKRHDSNRSAASSLAVHDDGKRRDHDSKGYADTICPKAFVSKNGKPYRIVTVCSGAGRCGGGSLAHTTVVETDADGSAVAGSARNGIVCVSVGAKALPRAIVTVTSVTNCSTICLLTAKGTVCVRNAERNDASVFLIPATA